MDRVSDVRLDVMLRRAEGVLDTHGVSVFLDADEARDALRELQGHRAAEREQAEPRKLDEVTCTITVNPGAYEAAMAVAGSKIAEFIRAKQPKPRTPAKWERRLAKMGGSLRYNAKDDQWEVWWWPPRGDVMDTVDFGKTPKAAVEAAWRAWKEERGE